MKQLLCLRNTGARCNFLGLESCTFAFHLFASAVQPFTLRSQANQRTTALTFLTQQVTEFMVLGVEAATTLGIGGFGLLSRRFNRLQLFRAVCDFRA